jgi:hypothetical protein
MRRVISILVVLCFLLSGLSLIVGIDDPGNISVDPINPSMVRGNLTVAYWPFDEGNGTVVYDQSVNKNDGNIISGSWVDGISGKALDFDGVNDYIQIPSDNSLSFNADFTLAMWIKHSGAAESNNGDGWRMISRQTHTDLYHIRIADSSSNVKNGLVEMEIRDEGPRYEVTSQTNVTDGSWYYIVGLRSGDEIKVYVNGELEGTANATSAPLTPGVDLQIGRIAMSDRDYFDGLIDEISMYNYALSDEEIEQNYEDLKPIINKTEEMVAHWPFDEGTGSVAYDQSGNNNDGNIISGSWVNGISGKALDFDGVNDYVQIPSDNSLSFNADFTLAMWIKHSGAAESNGIGGGWRMISRQTHTDLYHIRIADSSSNVKNGLVEMEIRDEGPLYEVTSQTNVTDGSWYYIVGLRSGDEIKVYVNGELEGKANATSAPLTPDVDLQIGRIAMSDREYFDGIIDEISMYNYALSDEEIEQNYEDMKPIINKTEELVAHWPFDENTGSVVYDHSGNNNDGDIISASWVDGINNSALGFNGTNDYVDVPTSTSLDITGEITIEAWIKAKGSSKYYAIVDKYRYTGGLTYGYTLYLTDGVLRLSIYSGSNGFGDLIGVADLRDDTWHHVVGEWDGTKISVYVDGEWEESVNWSYAPSSTTNDLGIGKRLSGWGGNMYFDGIIDEVSIYNYALSDETIKERYNGSEPDDDVDDDIVDDDVVDDDVVDDDVVDDDVVDDDVSDDDIVDDDDDDEDPQGNDTDDDGMDDKWEYAHFGDLSQLSSDDYDSDDHSNIEEFKAGTDPTNAGDHPGTYIDIDVIDTDGDNLGDDWEYTHFGDLDQDAPDDYDWDGYSNLEEFKDETDPTDQRDHPGSDSTDDDDDDIIGGDRNLLTMGIMIALIIIFVALTVAVIILLLVFKAKKGTEGKYIGEERMLDAESYQEPMLTDYYNDQVEDEWEDLEHDRTGDEGVLDELEDEALTFEKPSDFDLSNEEMIERLNEKYENGEVDEDTYQTIFETLENDKRY